MSERRVLWRPNKAALSRIKTTTVVVSIAAFLGGLGIIGVSNPATANRVAANQTSSVTTIAANNTSVQFLASQRTSIAPLTRTRGS